MTIKELIKEFLRGRDWTHVGPIADYVRSIDSARWNTTDRRCRELAADEILERREVQVDSKGPHVVQYRLKQVILPPAYPVKHDSKQMSML